MADTDWEPDPVIPGFLQSVMNEADAEHFDDGEVPEPDDIGDEESDAFDGDVGADVIGLINIGRLRRRVEVLGHRFVLRTLTVGEELAVSQVANEYAGTLMQGKAFQTAILASAIESVDGRPLVAALGPDAVASTQDRFDYIIDRWYGTTIDIIWAEYQVLQQRQAAAYERLMGESEASRITSTP